MAKQTEDGGVQADDLPIDLSQPARRAFAAAGYTRLEQFAAVTAAEILPLHGVGPKAIRQIERDLALRGLAFAAKTP